MKLLLFTEQKNSNFRLDPRTKLIMLFAVNLVLVSGGYDGLSGAVRQILAVLPFLLLIMEGGVRTALIYFIFIAAAISGETFLVQKTEGIANLLIVIFSGMITRFVPGLVMGYYVVSTTKIAEFVAALERMRIPKKIIIPFAVMMRFFPTAAEELAAIRDAMRMRGIGLGGNRPAAMLEYRLVPMLMCTVKIGEELSAAALTRGLGKPVRRTNICRIGFRLTDWLLILFSLGALSVWILF
ncbi:energy-coupling factor transporter transmembrane protein EcfT [Anoxybacterium hadale]|uniref:Energy-coupling factor transporter transmembrane protein EcfT n=1 Tax=Anoxybacterium hadale TaxID=3408580 RepID=A0ACD1AEI0_9FIRM|nr:energy-coupling factor transporter transmembrane protein EcfT [Clostridiales bacterium]